MPIRLRDSTASLGRITASLASFTAAFAGTSVAAAARTGTIGSQLAPFTSLLTGNFQPNANRTGTVATTLGSFTSNLQGTFTGAVGPGDFAARSTAPGVRAAWALASQSDLTTYYWPGGNGIAPVLDAAIKPSGQSASARFITQGTDGEGNVNMTFPFGPYVAGDVFWVSYRVRLDYELAYQPFLRSDNGSHSDMKTSIVSRYGSAGSFQQFEVVSAQNNQCDNLVSGYWQGLVGVDQSFIQWDTTKSMLPSGSDIMYQPELDRGSNPLTGTNPDTGAAWSTSEQQRARYGYPYNLSQNASDHRMGIGDPIGGYFRFYAGEFITITQRIDCRGFGSGNNTSALTVWAARDGQPYVKLLDKTGITFGGSGPFDGLWLTNFCTKRDGAASANRRITGRTTNITGVTLRNVGNGTSTGNGTLTYNAGTGRFTFAAQGESAGTARGWSAQKTLLNLASSGSNSWLGVEVTGTLPGSNQTDTVTIATGRNDTYSNYSEVIVSEQEIRAPGGHRAFPVSQFEALTANLAPGQRVQLTGMPGFTDANWTGATGYIFQYGPRGHYDPARREVWYLNSDHVSGNSLQKEVVYSLETNTWTFTTGPDGLSGPAHTYYHPCLNRRNGTRYMKPMAFDFGPAHPTRRRIYGQGWTTVAPLTEGSAIGAMDWHYGLASGSGAGAGGLVWGMTAGLYTSDSAVTTWTERVNFNRGGWLHPFSVSLHKRNLVYIGGGDSANDSNLRWWRCNANATFTELPALPKSMGVSGKAVPIEHPDGLRIVAMGGAPGDKSIIIYDPDTGAWSSSIGTHSFGDNGGNDYVFYVSLPEINADTGGRLLVVQSLGGGSPTCWGYRLPAG